MSTTVAADAATLPLGARLRANGHCSFCVWAPYAERLRLHLHPPHDRIIELQRTEHGYHTAVVADVPAGARYTCLFEDGRALPDPASRHQPDGVHEPSAVVPDAFDWRIADWHAPELREMVLYEIHVGTFTPEGTFDAAARRLPQLRELGINAIELMPVAQFPGTRNWGYDGVYPFAAQASYGGAIGLKRLVDAAHALDMAVALDVVYNHLGPEGNYLSAFGPYFTDAYRTPWGAALNFDGAGSDHVRRYFIESALQWTDEFRIDALRLDAIHSIVDTSARPFLLELADAVHERGRERGRAVILIAESDLGDPRVVRPASLGGLGMDAQWLDDFHHSLHTLFTGEDSGYYADFGTLGHLARAYRHGYVYSGEYSRYRRRRHGAPGRDILPHQLVVYAQNHDQIGNRMKGDRLATELESAPLRLAAAAVLLAPFTPMLFMGEEYGERRPFPYFVSHGDAELVEAVRRGRRAEFESFAWAGDPPDPQAVQTFRSAVLDWDARNRAGHRELLELHRRLIELRRSAPSIRGADALTVELRDTNGAPVDDHATEGVVIVRRRAADQSSILLLNFSARAVPVSVQAGGGAWRCALDTAAPACGGPSSTVPDQFREGASMDMRLAPHAAVLLLHDEA